MSTPSSPPPKSPASSSLDDAIAAELDAQAQEQKALQTRIEAEQARQGLGQSKVEVLRKNASASGQPSAYRQISRAYTNAIFLQAFATQFRGLMAVFGLGLLVSTGFAITFASFSIYGLWDAIQHGHFGFMTVGIISAIVGALAFIACFTAAIRTFRIDLFGPKEIPIVFNRKTRKVHRYVQDLPRFPSSGTWRELWESLPKIVRYWRSAFERWPMQLVSYDWDCLHAEHYAQTRLVGKVVTTIHVLQLVAHKSPQDDTITDVFTLTSPLITGRTTALDLWEHLRRYMEEGGAAVSEGDTLAPPFPTNLYQAANTVTPAWLAPVGGCAWAWWYMLQNGWPHQLHGYMATVVFMTAFVCTFITAIIVFNWLAHKWGTDITLPPELMADVGPPLKPGLLHRKHLSVV